jgi:multiple sugar transport system substrate-binding protein
MNDAFISGQAAMVMNYFAFFPALANSGINPHADVTGFFSTCWPDRAICLSAGLSVNAYIDAAAAGFADHQVACPGRYPA